MGDAVQRLVFAPSSPTGLADEQSPKTYSLGYSSPTAIDVTPFEEEDHNAAFIIQTRYRKYASRKGFNDTLAVLLRQAIESHISGSPPASPRWPEPVTKLQQRRRRVWVTCSDPSSSPFAFLVAVVILVAIIFSCSVFVR